MRPTRLAPWLIAVPAGVVVLGLAGCGGGGGGQDADSIEQSLLQADYVSPSCEEVTEEAAIDDFGEGVAKIKVLGSSGGEATTLDVQAYFRCEHGSGSVLAIVDQDDNVTLVGKDSSGVITGIDVLD